MKKRMAQKLISRVASKRVLDRNAKALKSYGFYRKTADLIDRVDVATGKKPTFKEAAGSTLHFDIEAHGTYSTTAHKI